MNVFFMYPDADFSLDTPLPETAVDLIVDLDLARIFDAMASEDPFVRKVVERAVMVSLHDPEVIQYRQAIMQDALSHPDAVRRLYQLASEALDRRKRHFYFGVTTRYPSSILHESADLLTTMTDMLRQLKAEVGRDREAFGSPALTQFAAMLDRELSDEYLATLAHYLGDLKQRDSVVLRARLGQGLKSAGYTLLKSTKSGRWIDRLLRRGPAHYSFQIPDRDQGGITALSEIRDRGINEVANALAQSAEHVLGFFQQLKTELAFYLGGIHLAERLRERGYPVCLPDLAESEAWRLSFGSLRDVGLVLSTGQPVVGNDGAAQDLSLLVITGANQGGKSTFLRSLGQAHLMAQAGLFVAAEHFASNIMAGLASHFAREEDASMERGKFEEELERMSRLMGAMRPGAFMLWNESFQSTNEREGSDVAQEITRALVDSGVRIAFVTHLNAYAEALFQEHRPDCVFLRAERLDNGTRTYRIVPGPPMETSFGVDLYQEIFGQQHAGER